MQLNSIPVASASSGSRRLDDVSDSLISELRNAAVVSPNAEDPQLQRLVRLAKAIRFESTPTVDPSPIQDGAEDVPLHLRRVGDYELLKKLGEGSFGAVYLARGVLLQRLVALKILHEAHRSNTLVKDRFLQEMKAVGKLQNHPHVVHAFQASEEKGTLFLVMEYVEGINLSRLLEQQKRLAVAHACEVVRQSALGLQYIHEHGLVHRDVKPGNLILSIQGQVKVLDLGLARLSEEPGEDGRRTVLGQIMGTYDYMAPEQARDARQADLRADLYSLGCTLFHLLTGQVPFPGNNKQDKIEAHRLRPAPLLADLRAGLPGELQTVVSRLMAKQPADRYQTAREVAVNLEPYCQNAALNVLLGAPEQDAVLPTTTDEPKTRLPTTTHEPKRRWGWVVLTVVVGILLLVMGFQLSRWVPRNPAEKQGEKPSEKSPSAPPLSLVGLRGSARSLAFALDGRRVVAQEDNRLHSWDLDKPDQEMSWELQDSRSGLANSNVVFVTGGQIMVGLNTGVARAQLQRFDVRSGIPVGDPCKCNGNIHCLSVSRDGGRVLVGHTNSQVRIQEVITYKVLNELQPGSVVRTATFSADGKRVLCSCDDGSVRLYDSHVNRAPLWTSGGHADVLAVALSPDGRRAGAVSQQDQTLRLWDVETSEPFRTVQTNEDGNAMTCAAFTLDARMAVVGRDDGSVNVWDLGRRKCLGSFRRHEGPVASVALSPDGRKAASAGKDDRQVWVYSLPTLDTEPLEP